MWAVPPHLYFLVSALFHYLGASFAVLLFAHLGVVGVAWLRIASAAIVFGAWRRPWTVFCGLSPGHRWVLVALGVLLGVMNSCFYLAIATLPLATVGAIEFIGPIGLAVIGMRTQRNLLALVLAVAGGYLLTTVRLQGQPIGFVFAVANYALFALYIVLAHPIPPRGPPARVHGLGAAMLIALVVVVP